MHRVVLIPALLFWIVAGDLLAQPQPRNWREAVDAYWPSNVSTDEQLHLFDMFWVRVDTVFPAFHNIDVDWSVLRAKYRPEIEAGVTRGRFAGIMNHLALSLREQHTYA